MAYIGLEAGAHLLEGLILVAEEGEGRRIAVFCLVAGMEIRHFIARPVKNDEILVIGARCRGCKSACQVRMQASGVCGWFPLFCAPVSRAFCSQVESLGVAQM